jgi:hypothetical protein
MTSRSVARSAFSSVYWWPLQLVWRRKYGTTPQTTMLQWKEKLTNCRLLPP